MADRLVGSGSFRVDRSRALDKLMRFQLPDARMYPLPWVQAAVASGATFIRIVSQPAGVEFAFDGAPWAKDELSDPYRHLFDEDPDGSKTRHRELAIGLLTALRVPPTHISASFLDQGKEWVLHVKDVTTESLEEGELRDLAAPSMRLFVAGALGFAKEKQFLERFARNCPVPIELARARINLPPDEPFLQEVPFGDASVSGVVRLPAFPPDASRLELVTHGVVVAEERLRLPGAQLEGWVRNDGFRKTLSQMGVVKDAFYLQAVGAIAALSQSLLKETVLRVSQGAAESGRLLFDPANRGAWMPWETTGFAERLGALLAAAPGKGDGPAKTLTQHSARVAAVRVACLHRRSDILSGRSQDGLHDALADAPVLFDAEGRPLSLRPLLAQARWLGHVPYVDGEPGGSGALTAAWVVREADRRFLDAFFPDAARRLKADAASAFDPKSRPILDDPNLIVKLPFMAGPVSGEAGLSLTPHTRRARLRWIGSRGPLGQGVWELKGLRLEAVVHHPELDDAPREEAPSAEARAGIAAVLQAVPSLYQLLAREYVPEEESPRMAVVREHLMDFLRLVCDTRTFETPAAPWLRRLPLMLDRQGRRVSLEDLARRGAGGRRTPLRATIHPDRFQPLVAGYPDHMRLLFGSSDAVELGGTSPAPAPKPAEALRPPKTARLEPKPAAAPPPEPAPPPPSDPAPAAARAARPARPEPQGDLALDPAAELRRILVELKKRGACQIPEPAVRSLRFVERTGTKLLRFHPDAAWELDTRSPLAAALAALPPAERVWFMASLTHSGLNRALSGLTDAQDAVFTEALAALALELDGA